MAASSENTALERTMATKFVDFMNASRSAFSAVSTAKEELLKAGFVALNETELWTNRIKPGGRYFFTRNDSTIAAFVVGGKVATSVPAAFVVSAAHTDSPCLKLKPVSNINKNGALQLGVETYGSSRFRETCSTP